MRIFISLLIGAAAHAGSSAAEVPMVDYQARISDAATLVGMDCQAKNRTLEIGNYHADNRPRKRMDLWTTDSLVVWDRETADLLTTLSVERSCKIGGAEYTVKLTGAPGAWNTTRQCGDFVSARATVWKDGHLVFDDILEECMGSKRGIATVRFTPASHKPVVKRLR